MVSISKSSYFSIGSRTLRWIGSLGAVAWILSVVPYGQITASFERFDAVGISAAATLLVANLILALVRFRAMLRARDARPGWMATSVAFGIGQVSNSFLLNIVGQSLGRAAYLARHGVDFGATVLATYLERMIALGVLGLLVVAAAWILVLDLVPGPGPGAAQFAFFAGSAAVALACAVHAVFGLRNVAGGFSRFLRKARRYGGAALLTLGAHLAMLAAYLALLADLGADALRATTCAAIVIVMLLSSIPISFAGWGLRELSAAHVLSLIGIPMADAIAASLLVGLISLLLTLAVGGGAILRASSETRRALPQDGAPGAVIAGAETIAVLKGCILLCACLVFFQMRLPVAGGELTINLADVFALTGVGLVAFLHTRERIWSEPNLLAALTLISIGIAIAFATGYARYGLNAWATTNRGIGWIAIVGYAALGAAAGRDPSLRAAMLRVMLVAGAWVSALQLALIVPAGAIDLSVVGHFVPLRGFAQNANAFAVQLIALIVIAIVARAGEDLPARRAALWLIALFSAAVFLTRSRSGMVMLAMLAVLAPFARSWRPGRGDLQVCGAIATGGMLAFAVPRAIATVTGLLPSVPPIRLVEPWSDGERWQSISDGFALWLQHPLLGSGLGGYVNARILTGLDFQVIHSVPVWLLAEFGILGGLPVLLGCVVLVLTSLTAFASQRTRIWGFATTGLLACVGAGCLVHDFFFQRVFWLTLGLFLGGARQAQGDAGGIGAIAWIRARRVRSTRG